MKERWGQWHSRQRQWHVQRPGATVQGRTWQALWSGGVFMGLWKGRAGGDTASMRKNLILPVTLQEEGSQSFVCSRTRPVFGEGLLCARTMEPVVNKTITNGCLCEPDILYWRGLVRA